MYSPITKTTELAMRVTLEHVERGDIVIDATCGNGCDTCALAEAAGESGKVYAFDIQERALAATERRLREFCVSEAGCVQLILGSFTGMGEYVQDNSAAAVVFNLGYLPGGDHSITTTADETLEGIKAALRAIKPGGIITIVMYDGHAEGMAEKKHVLEWAETLDPVKYHAAYVSMVNQKKNPPEIMWITKKK